MSTSDRRYFVIDEANRMIPWLEQLFGRMLQLHAQIREAHTRLGEVGFAPEIDEFDLHPPDADAQVLSDLASLRTLIDALRDDVIEIARAGCIVKSVDTGLVDWYAKLDGRDILLCWKLGEKTVGYWHELDVGFAGRQSIALLSAGKDGYSLR